LEFAVYGFRKPRTPWGSSPRRGARSSVRNIDTGGGDCAEGDIDKRRGSFVSGDQINMTGSFRNVNIKSTLSNVAQSIGAAPHGDAAWLRPIRRIWAAAI
jgi:hypothetical protein